MLQLVKPVCCITAVDVTESLLSVAQEPRGCRFPLEEWEYFEFDIEHTFVSVGGTLYKTPGILPLQRQLSCLFIWQIDWEFARQCVSINFVVPLDLMTCFFQTVTIEWPTTPGPTYEEAKANCTAALIESDIGLACGTLPFDFSMFFDSCMMDIKVKF